MLPETDIDIITHAYYDSPVGVLKIGGTEHYITEISFAAKETEPFPQNSSGPFAVITAFCISFTTKFKTTVVVQPD